MKTEIDTTQRNIELLTTKEVCEILDIKANTFYRHYRRNLTAYKNAEKSDNRYYWDKKEVITLSEDRKPKKPKKVFIDE